MRCKFCQNYQISQQVLEVEEINPGEIIRLIKRIDNNVWIAFTYNEPFILYEYIL